MIVDDFLVFDDRGLYCRYGDFYLDPQQPVQHAVISHAHGDHAVRGNEHVYCTEATAAIMACRYKKQAGGYLNTYSYDQTFIRKDVQIHFIPAGHILGSAQIMLIYKGVRYLYTGDFKLQEDVTCEPIAFVQADVLITETTFADPAVQHPDPVKEIQKLNNFPSNILLGTYALGKAQRLIQLINAHCSDRRILVHHTILPINKIYEQFGYALGKYQPYQRKVMKLTTQGFIYLVPPMTFDSYFRAKNVLRAFASGWKNLHYQNDISLFISDHVDWNDIIRMINRVKPKQIWTLHGDGHLLKAHYDNHIPVKELNV